MVRPAGRVGGGGLGAPPRDLGGVVGGGRGQGVGGGRGQGPDDVGPVVPPRHLDLLLLTLPTPTKEKYLNI